MSRPASFSPGLGLRHQIGNTTPQAAMDVRIAGMGRDWPVWGRVMMKLVAIA